MFVSLQKQCREGYSLHLFDDGTLARLASACNTPIININIMCTSLTMMLHPMNYELRAMTTSDAYHGRMRLS